MGHSAFFFEYFLLRELYGGGPRMPGYDEMWDSFEIPHKERWREGVVPGREETLHYYDRVISECRQRLDAPGELTADEAYLFQYVIAHQCMHLESLIWCRQSLGYAAPPFVKAPQTSAAREDVQIPGGEYFIGKARQDSREEMAADFCFDNEKPGFVKSLEPFRICQSLVSNAEFLEFVEDGGYETLDHWSFGGQFWLRESAATTPEYWEKRDGEWYLRRFDQWHPLPLEEPIMHVNFREAEAFCRWAGRRLPTEFEWEAAASLQKCDQMLGTAWQWTTSQYLPFAGFEVDMYAYMSTLQFGDHKTTRGGSWATSESLLRPTYRQAYFPNRRDVFAGFRTCAVE
jgi:iron(II)-dependent oxidoreductase